MPKVTRTRNPELIPGVRRFSRCAAFRRNGRWAIKNKAKAAKKVEEVKEARVGKWYPTEDVAKPLKSRKGNKKPTKLRSSIAPGQILILLAGRFKGKRVVFLKQLESGLLLVTGPFKING